MTVSSLQPLDPKQFDERCAQHLLQRAGFGGTPQQALALSKLGLKKSVEYIINFKELPDPDSPSLSDYDKDLIRPLTVEERAIL
ncbi:MAG: hypothetical protein ACKVIO_04735, partial [Phycisphaerales bacterium]